MPKNIFITGITGCVGHYLFDVLANDSNYHLYLLVRNTEKIKFNYKSHTNVEIIQDDLNHIKKYADLLKDMDYVVHLAAVWGGRGAWEANYKDTYILFKLLDSKRCQKIVYVSTASILDEKGKLSKGSGLYGPSYIKSKYLSYKHLDTLEIHEHIITLFPTLILGGDKKHPYSHASLSIPALFKWINILRFFKFELNFNFIHAQDISLIIKHFIENDTKESGCILGNKKVDFNEVVREGCKKLNKKLFFQIKISPKLIELLAKLARRPISAWDAYCLNRKNWNFDRAVNAASFGIESQFQTVSDILNSYEENNHA